MSIATRASPLAAARKTIADGAGPDGRTNPSVKMDEPDSAKAAGKPPHLSGHSSSAKPTYRLASQVTSRLMSQVGPLAARIRSRCLRPSTRVVIFRKNPRTSHPSDEPKAERDARGISRVLITLEAVASSRTTPTAKPSHRTILTPEDPRPA